MTNVVLSPADGLVGPSAIFLAGGITGAPDWQAKAIEYLDGCDVDTIVNPRRADYTDDMQVEFEQIAWEHRYLTQYNLLPLFWFPKEAKCMITLLEYGKHALGRCDRVVVGVEAGYVRERDLLIQTALERPDVPIYRTLNDTLEAAVAML